MQQEIAFKPFASKALMHLPRTQRVPVREASAMLRARTASDGRFRTRRLNSTLHADREVSNATKRSMRTPGTAPSSLAQSQLAKRESVVAIHPKGVRAQWPNGHFQVHPASDTVSALAGIVHMLPSSLNLLSIAGLNRVWGRSLPATLTSKEAASGVTVPTRSRGLERVWSINGRFLTQPTTGVQRYAHEVIRALDQLCYERHPLAAHTRIEILSPLGGPQIRGLRTITHRPVGNIGGQIWEQTVLPAHVRGGLLSLCNVGPLAIAKQIVCIHDLNTRECPESYALPFRALYRVLLPALGRRARAIATVSNYTASQLDAYGVASRSKLCIIPNGHEHALQWQTNHAPSTSAPSNSDTIVLLGGTAPHKNGRLILDLAPDLARLGLKIAVVGASDASVFSNSGPALHAPNIRWLGRVKDDALATLLKEALCLAFPSYVEGFGLPPLEAMALGCPVVVSNRASLPEVCGSAALYASPTDGQMWLEAFRRLHTEPNLRAKLKAAGRLRAHRFSWRRSAELYLEAMAQLDDFGA
jgi:glycosyltransferase involved in cell wall biosynthesis